MVRFLSTAAVYIASLALLSVTTAAISPASLSYGVAGRTTSDMCSIYSDKTSCATVGYPCYWCGATSTGQCQLTGKSCDYCSKLSKDTNRTCAQLASVGCKWCHTLLECASSGYECPFCSSLNTTTECDAHSTKDASRPGCAWCPLMDMCLSQGQCKCSAASLNPPLCTSAPGCQWCASGSCQNASRSCPACSQLTSEYGCNYMGAGDSPCSWCSTTLTCYDSGISYNCPTCDQLGRDACLNTSQGGNFFPCQWCNASGPAAAECTDFLISCPFWFPYETSYTGRYVGIGIGAAVAIAVAVAIMRRVLCVGFRLGVRGAAKSGQATRLLAGSAGEPQVVSVNAK